MIQVAQTASFGPMAASSGTNISTVFARHIVKRVEHAAKSRKVVETVLRIQKDMYAICRQCGERWPVAFLSRSYARRVCNLAPSMAFDELVQELKRRLDEHAPQCPRCAHADDCAGRATAN